MLKLSIIVPVYNSELYLERLINSVLNQTYEKWELIFVDDASTDMSCKIIEHFSNIDSRIRLIKNPQNGGPAKARNIGIDEATGEYLGFVDSDDYVSPDYARVMLDYAVSNNADIVWCNIKEINDVSFIESVPICEEGKLRKYDRIEALRLFYSDTMGLGSMCNKIYRKSIINKYHLRLNEIRTRAEDWEFNLKVFEQINTMVAIENILYFYVRANTHSIMATFREKDFDLMCESSNILLRLNRRYQLGFPTGFDTDKNAHSFIEYLIKASRQGGIRRIEIISHVLSSLQFREVMRNCHIQSLPPSFQIIRLGTFTNNAKIVNGLCKLLCN